MSSLIRKPASKQHDMPSNILFYTEIAKSMLLVAAGVLGKAVGLRNGGSRDYAHPCRIRHWHGRAGH
jgi:hypothetical protein